jgi:hypothetical protein
VYRPEGDRSGITSPRAAIAIAGLLILTIPLLYRATTTRCGSKEVRQVSGS